MTVAEKTPVFLWTGELTGGNDHIIVEGTGETIIEGYIEKEVVYGSMGLAGQDKKNLMMLLLLQIRSPLKSVKLFLLDSPASQIQQLKVSSHTQATTQVLLQLTPLV